MDFVHVCMELETVVYFSSEVFVMGIFFLSREAWVIVCINPHIPFQHTHTHVLFEDLLGFEIWPHCFIIIEYDFNIFDPTFLIY